MVELSSPANDILVGNRANPFHNPLPSGTGVLLLYRVEAADAAHPG